MKIGSLFSGAGGLDMAVEQMFGGTTIWHVENDAAASKVLAHRWPGVPNYGDITTTDWNTVQPVDILCGGWPCQPFSHAGKRLGAEDERALWPYVAGAIRLLRPAIIVLENVSAVLTAGEFQRVVDDLASSGYEFGWVCVRASDVGAPHRRERVFILATDTTFAERGGTQPEHLGAARNGAAEPRERFSANPFGGGDAADSSGDGWDEGRPESARQQRGSDASLSGAGPVNLLPTPVSRDYKGDTPGRTDKLAGAIDALLPTPRTSDRFGAGLHGNGGPDLRTTISLLPTPDRWGKYAPAIRRWEHATRPAPAPTEPNRNGNPRLNPQFSEWMMGWPNGWVTQVPGISRSDQLKIIGNGVCPQQAAAALTHLLTHTPATVGA